MHTFIVFNVFKFISLYLSLLLSFQHSVIGISIPRSTNLLNSDSSSNEEDNRWVNGVGSQIHGLLKSQKPNSAFQDKELHPDLWIAAHNSIRRHHGASELTWDHTLAQAAQVTTDTCIFAHTENNSYGEDSPDEVVEDWINGPNEKEDYDPENPNPSHFTQVIWKSTTQIGCAFTKCDSVQGVSLPQSIKYFWACEYNHPGNVLGEFPDNVKSGKGGVPLD
ncbi:secreted protein [Melampsora americana]|nr:secreted protein [Melampsora americana]